MDRNERRVIVRALGNGENWQCRGTASTGREEAAHSVEDALALTLSRTLNGAADSSYLPGPVVLQDRYLPHQGAKRRDDLSGALTVNCTCRAAARFCIAGRCPRPWRVGFLTSSSVAASVCSAWKLERGCASIDTVVGSFGQLLG